MEINRGSQDIVKDFLDVANMSDPKLPFKEIYRTSPLLGKKAEYNSATHLVPEERDPTLVYERNCWGFRKMHDDPSINSIVTLGCSDTFGIGHEIEDTWVHKVSKKLRRKVWNLGQPGAGIDTCFYSLQVVGDKIKFDTVFFLIPAAYRVYIWYANSTKDNRTIRQQYTATSFQEKDLKLGSTTVSPEDLAQGILFTEENVLMTNLTALNAIENYCRKKGAKLIYMFNPFAYYTNKEEMDFFKSYQPFGRARDNSHMGVPFQTAVADVFLKKYKETVGSNKDISYI